MAFLREGDLERLIVSAAERTTGVVRFAHGVTPVVEAQNSDLAREYIQSVPTLAGFFMKALEDPDVAPLVLRGFGAKLREAVCISANHQFILGEYQAAVQLRQVIEGSPQTQLVVRLETTDDQNSDRVRRLVEKFPAVVAHPSLVHPTDHTLTWEFREGREPKGGVGVNFLEAARRLSPYDFIYRTVDDTLNRPNLLQEFVLGIDLTMVNISKKVMQEVTGEQSREGLANKVGAINNAIAFLRPAFGTK